MKTNVFGMVLGGILLAWLVVFYFLGWAPKASFDEKKREVDSQISVMSRYARMDLDHFPRESLAKEKEQLAEGTARNFKEAVELMDERDAAFQSWITGGSSAPDLVAWEAVYRDRFRDLSERYRAHAKLDEAALPPFKSNDAIARQDELDRYEKRWKGLSTIVETVMAFASARLEQVEYDDRPKDVGNLGNNERFARARWVIVGRATPSEFSQLLKRLLDQRAITFEVHEMILAKRRDSLQESMLQPLREGEQALAEPAIRFRLALNVLDWVHVARSEGADKGA